MSEKTWKWVSCKNPDGGDGHIVHKWQTCKPNPSEENKMKKMVVRIGRSDTGRNDFIYRTINRGETISCSPQGFAGKPNPVKYNYCYFLDYR